MAKKYSRKREAILSVIRNTKLHPSAGWIYDELRPSIPDLSLGTVYRNIASFKDEGVIRSVGVVDGEERFDGDTSGHAHLICDTCGKVMDVEMDYEGAVAFTAIAKENGFEISRYDLVFYGLCPDCM